MAYGDIQRMIREIEPPRPSTRLSTLGETLSTIAAQRRTESRKLGQLLRGELDWIVMKCLEKDRTRRYEAAASLANDIQRHLDNERVLARPVTRAYRVQKFISRHRRGVAVTAVTVLMFIGLMIALIIQTGRAVSSQKLEAEQRRIAESARDRERTTEGLAKQNLIKGLILVGDKLLASGQETEARNYYGQALDTAKTFGIPEAPALIALLPMDEQLPLMGHYGENSGAGGFIGHAKNATCVVLRRDGRTAITASEDGTIKVWDLMSGREIRTLPGHSGGVALVALAPNDRTLLSASHKGEVWLWDVERAESSHLSEGGADVWALAISPDGGTALAGSVGGQIRKWDLTTRTELPSFDVNNMHTRAVAYLAFSPDGQRVLSGGHDSFVKLWDAASGKCIQTLAGHGGPVNCVLFLPDGLSAISASFDGTLRTWNLETGAKIHEFRGHQAEIWRVALSPDGKTAFSGGRDETVRSWDVSSGRQIRSFAGQADGAMGVAVSGDGKLVVATGGESFLRAWDCRPDRGIGPLDFPDAITSVAMSDQRMILFGSSQGRLILWDRDARRPLQEFSKAGSAIKSVAISSDGAHVLSVGENGRPALWDVASEKVLQLAQQGNVNCVAFATDDLALCGGADGVIRMWSVRDGQEKRNFPGHSGAVTSISVALDGRSMISVSKDGTARVWDLAGVAAARVLSPPKAVIAAALGPDGQKAVTLGQDGVIRMWDVAGQRQTGSMQDEKIPPPTAMTLSPDGHIAWTCANDGAVTAWDTVSGSRIRSLVTHAGQATCIAANGSCVVSGGIDKTIRLWDLSRPAAYREFERKLESVHKSLNTNPNDATALAVLGEWYAFRQFDHWAVDLLERARNAGAQVSPLMLAHCYWNLSESDPAYAAKALEQFQRALKHNEAPESYLTLCMKAVSRVQARSN